VIVTQPKVWKMSNCPIGKTTTSNALDAVWQCKKKLTRHLQDNDPDLILLCLFKLDRVPMTYDILEETLVGRVVNGLKHRSDLDVEAADLAKTIVKKWKDMVANHEEREEAEAAAAKAKEEAAQRPSEAEEPEEEEAEDEEDEPSPSPPPPPPTSKSDQHHKAQQAMMASRRQVRRNRDVSPTLTPPRPTSPAVTRGRGAQGRQQEAQQAVMTSRRHVRRNRDVSPTLTPPRPTSPAVTRGRGVQVRQQEVEVTKFVGPYLKYECKTQEFKPQFSEDKWKRFPRLFFTGTPGTSPYYKPPKIKTSIQNNPKQSIQDLKKVPSPKKLTKVSKVSHPIKHKMRRIKDREVTIEPIKRSSKIMPPPPPATAVSVPVEKTQDRENKPGWCDLCELWYTKIFEHLETDKHKNKVKDKWMWKDLDNIIEETNQGFEDSFDFEDYNDDIKMSSSPAY